MKRSVFMTVIAVLLLIPLFLLTGCSSWPKAADLLPFDYNTYLNSDGFFDGVTAAKSVKLPKYVGIEVPESVLTVTEAALQEQVDSICASYATVEKITDRAVTHEDTVNMDYVGKIDGVAFDRGSTNGQGTDATIAAGNYIDDFLDQLVGHMPGETFDIEVTFPDPYKPDETKSGKDAVFTITLNYIHGEASVPELNDTIAADYGFANADELLQEIKDWLIDQQKLSYMKTLLGDAKAKGSVPQNVVNYVIGSELEQYRQYAEQQDKELDSYLKEKLGFASADKFIADKENQKGFKDGAVYYLAYQAIAEEQGLTVTEEDVEAAGYSEYVEQYGEAYIKLIVLQSVIVPDFIFENAAK